MSKTRVIVVICFLATFAAGMVAGVALTRRDRHEPRRQRRPWIEKELNLTGEQREKMREIWSEVMGKLREYQRDQRQALQQERDEAIQNLLSVQQRAEYAQIREIYARESAALNEAERKAFEEATQRTKEILTKEQQEAYEKMLRERASRRRHGSHGRREAEGSGADAPPAPEDGEPGPPPPPPPF